MNTMKRVSLFVFVAALSFILGACYPRHNSPEERVAWVSERVADYLDLNVDQKRKLDQLRDEVISTGQAMREDGRTSGEELLIMLENQKMDREKALAVINHRLDTLKARAPELVNLFGDLYDSLNADQQDEVRQPIEKRVARYAAYTEE
jgi:Spy/CpxP family protein refolding chaperone